MHLSDIGPESGPLTVLPAARTEAFADEIGYDTSVEYRLPDQTVDAFVSEIDIVQFAGPVETVDFVDTSGCLHLGSSVEPDAPARRVFTAQYLTPYAFKFERDHREEAPFRDLASSASSDSNRWSWVLPDLTAMLDGRPPRRRPQTLQSYAPRSTPISFAVARLLAA